MAWSAEHTVYIIDGSSFLYRAYHGLQPMHTLSGMPVQAVFGFCRMIHKVLKEFKPHCLCVVWDGPGKTIRHEVYAEYKATRQAAPSDLFEQKEYIVKALHLMGIAQLQEPGVEADDLMYALARTAHEAQQEVVLITSDKDMRQIIGPHLKIYDPFQQTVLDEDAIQLKYGFGVKKLPFYFALLGDSSDNIPGVKGVGKKTAEDLVKQFDSLEHMYAHLDRIEKPRTRALLEASRDNAFLSLDLFTLKKLSAPLAIESCVVVPDAWERARPVFEELNFQSLLKTIPSVTGAAQLEDVSFAKAYGVEFVTVTTDEELNEMCAAIEAAGYCALDTETNSQHALRSVLVGMSFCVEKGRSYYIPLAHDTPTPLHKGYAKERLKTLLEDARIKKYLHHAKFDMMVLFGQGIQMQGLAFDTLLAASLVRKEGTKINLKDLSYATFGERMRTFKEVVFEKGHRSFIHVPLDLATDYAAADAHQTFKLVDILQHQLEDNGMKALYYEIELPLLYVLYEMECAGVRIDLTTLNKLKARLQERAREIEQQFELYLGPQAYDINYNSPKQIAELLFETLSLQPLKKTSGKTGYSTDNEVLTQLAKEHPVPALILAHREVQKVISTYVEGILEVVNPKTGKVHTTFNQTLVATGRLSSSDPNLQNIPTTSPVRDMHIRQVFIPDEGYTFISADYSQIELRVLAYFSQDAALCKAFLNNEDIHARTAVGLFGVALEDVTHEQRQVAKRINFSILYGLTPYGLSQDLEIPLSQAKLYIDRYIQTYPEVFSWMESIVEETLAHEYVTTEWGRRRYVPELFERNKVLHDQGRRVAINTKVQGTAAELVKKGMLAVDTALKQTGVDAQLLIQIHDELLLQVKDDQINLVRQLVKEALEGVVAWNIPLLITLNEGKNWYEASK